MTQLSDYVQSHATVEREREELRSTGNSWECRAMAISQKYDLTLIMRISTILSVQLETFY